MLETFATLLKRGIDDAAAQQEMNGVSLGRGLLAGMNMLLSGFGSGSVSDHASEAGPDEVQAEGAVAETGREVADEQASSEPSPLCSTLISTKHPSQAYHGSVPTVAQLPQAHPCEIGRASCRERV